MPTPHKNESREKFVNRCMKYSDSATSELTQEQKLGRCYGIYKSSKKQHTTKKSAHCGLTCNCEDCHKNVRAFLYKAGPNTIALANLDESEIETNDRTRSAKGLLSSSNRDWQGDVIVCGGVDTTYHRYNPISLWNHGRTGYTFPIGKTEDKEGNYTVKYHPQEDIITQETFFAPTKFAQQVYKLVREGFIRSNSIALKDTRVEPLAADPEMGFLRKGKKVLESYLAEVTWTALGANPDATASLLGKNRIDGEQLDPILYKSLVPFLPPKKVWANGLTLKSEQAEDEMEPIDIDALEKEAMENLQKQNGKAKHKENGHLTTKQEMEEENPGEGEEEESAESPHGAAILRAAYALICAARTDMEEDLGSVDQEAVKECLEESSDQLAGIKAKMEEVFTKTYPDEEPLSHEGDSEGEEGDYEEEDDSEKSVKKLTRKAKQVDEMEDEDLDEEDDEDSDRDEVIDDDEELELDEEEEEAPPKRKKARKKPPVKKPRKKAISSRKSLTQGEAAEYRTMLRLKQKYHDVLTGKKY